MTLLAFLSGVSGFTWGLLVSCLIIANVQSLSFLFSHLASGLQLFPLPLREKVKGPSGVHQTRLEGLVLWQDECPEEARQEVHCTPRALWVAVVSWELTRGGRTTLPLCPSPWWTAALFGGYWMHNAAPHSAGPSFGVDCLQIQILPLLSLVTEG